MQSYLVFMNTMGLTAKESLRWALQQKDWNRVQVSGSMAEGAIVRLPEINTTADPESSAHRINMDSQGILNPA